MSRFADGEKVVVQHKKRISTRYGLDNPREMNRFHDRWQWLLTPMGCIDKVRQEARVQWVTDFVPKKPAIRLKKESAAFYR